jgi:uncharacterized membrane protein
MKILRFVLYFQAVYYILSGLWPLFDIGSFMQVTGPKTEIWLIQSTGLQAMVTGITLLISWFTKRISPAIFFLAVGSALVFLLLDFIYVLNGTLSEIYLMDAFLQLVFIFLWIVSIFKTRRNTFGKAMRERNRITWK